MSYATLSDFYARYSRDSLNILAEKRIDNLLDLDEHVLEQQRNQILQLALDDAKATIDGYIDGRATLPLKTVPQVLVRLSCVLARFSLEDASATDKSTADYAGAIKLLESVAAGDVSLGLSIDDKRAEGGDVATLTSAGSVWARQKSKGFI